MICNFSILELYFVERAMYLLKDQKFFNLKIAEITCGHGRVGQWRSNFYHSLSNQKMKLREAYRIIIHNALSSAVETL